MELIIKDKGELREVRIKGRFCSKGRYPSEHVFETFYSEELLRKIFEVMQGYFKDDIDRSEDPGYLEIPLINFLKHYSIGLGDKKVLDFGCGSGASSIILTKLGARRVVGVDIDESRLSIARLRVRDYGFNDKIELHLLSGTSTLLFENSSFDIVLCQGAIEHIDYRKRGNWIKEMWRVVAGGGYLIILETPNRLWPQDTHTTGLWFLPYLPTRLAHVYAKVFKAIDKNHTFEELLAMGIRGATYWEVISPIKSYGLIEMNRELPMEVDAVFPLDSSKEQNFLVRNLKRLTRMVFQIIDIIILRPFNIPFSAFSPYLNICLKKRV